MNKTQSYLFVKVFKLLTGPYLWAKTKKHPTVASKAILAAWSKL